MENPTEYLALGITTARYVRTYPEWNYYNGERWIAFGTAYLKGWVTFDENIKSIHDFAGKKVNIPRKGASSHDECKLWLEQYGVLDKVAALEASGTGTAMQNLRDGLVDVAAGSNDLVLPGGFGRSGHTEGLYVKGPVYYPTMDREGLVEINKKAGASFPVRVPPGAFDAKTQQEETWWANWPVYFTCDEKVDPDIVNEAVRVLWETAGEWSSWHALGANIQKEWLPACTMELDRVHPGAAKFYQDNGIDVEYFLDML